MPGETFGYTLTPASKFQHPCLQGTWVSSSRLLSFAIQRNSKFVKLGSNFLVCARARAFFFFPRESLLFSVSGSGAGAAIAIAQIKKKETQGVLTAISELEEPWHENTAWAVLSALIKPIILCDVLDKASKFSAFDYLLAFGILKI